MQMINNLFLTLTLLLVSCASNSKYQAVTMAGPLTTYARGDHRIDVILINGGLKICPQDEGEIRNGFYSPIRSKSNYTLRFERQRNCFWAPMNIDRKKSYRVYVMVEELNKGPREVMFEF
ncbi:hypothetical protein [Peredibacter starrii]|uniref:Lipoprotein n=1 Tax=Peredibacter starrii TaxID=28202 RepID=A0AAX4HUL8_9BACT|nr:hypothetical protein [Peredibacter starrii]WPU66676.1 hypothetical protein SOO65_07950 [Peredibacter starrii]